MTRTPRPLRWLGPCPRPADPPGRRGREPVIPAGHHEARLDPLLGDGWALLTDGPAPAAPAGVRHIDISALDPAGPAQLRRWWRNLRPHAVLVRPDRIIAATGAARPHHPHPRYLDWTGIPMTDMLWP